MREREMGKGVVSFYIHYKKKFTFDSSFKLDIFICSTWPHFAEALVEPAISFENFARVLSAQRSVNKKQTKQLHYLELAVFANNFMSQWRLC